VLCPFGFTLARAYYDVIIDIEDTESGYGGKTCESTLDPAYYSETLNASSCAAVASAVQAAGCCAPKCPLCDIGSLIPVESNETFVDGISLPGYDDGVTCANLNKAAYISGMLGMEICPASRQAAADAGCCVPYQCLTCDVGSYIPSSLNATICYDLRASELIFFNTNLTDEDCRAATQLAVDEGCCMSTPVYNVCNVCGDATFYPDNILYQVGTCDYAVSTSSAEVCATYSSFIAASCCAKEALPGNNDDTEAPVLAPTSPPSASSSMWSSTGGVVVVVSMMCLTSGMLSSSVGAWLWDWN
jgi:hypothetical protein